MTWQMPKLAGKCPVTDCYYEHCTPHQIWKVSPLHVKCEEWLLSTSNVKSYASIRQIWSSSSPHKMERVTSPYGKFVSNPQQMRKLTPPHKFWRETPPHQMWRVTPLHIKCEEWLLSMSKVKCDYSLRQIKRVILNMMSDYSPHQMWRVTFSTSNVKSDSRLKSYSS
jgi:hypothetical protein